MHDFDLLHNNRGARLLTLALASLSLIACPAEDSSTSADESSSDGGATEATATADSTDTDAIDTDAADSTDTDAIDTDAADSTDSDATDTDAADSTDSDATDTDADTTTTGPRTYSLSGTIGRTVDFAPGNDGIGTLVIGAFGECGLGQSLLASAVVPAADLSDPNARIAFTLEGLPSGPVYVGLFLDDNGDLDPMAPHPDEGDLVYGFDPCDGDLDCVDLEITDADLVDVALDLNLLELDVCP